jgi:hypothetical protein
LLTRRLVLLLSLQRSVFGTKPPLKILSCADMYIEAVGGAVSCGGPKENLRHRLITDLREGADATNPSRVLEFITDIVAVWLLSLNALLSLTLLPWSRYRSKRQPKREPQQPAEPIRVLLDSEFHYVAMDPEFCELIGHSKDELIGKDAEYVTPTGFCNIREFRKQVRLMGKKDGFWMYRRGDGSLVLVHYSITATTTWLICSSRLRVGKR